MECPNCKFQVPLGSQFCGQCGARLESEERDLFHIGYQPASATTLAARTTPSGRGSGLAAQPGRDGGSSGGTAFVGRQSEMDDLKAALEDALAGQGRMVMLVGEPGIGKTRTAQELSDYAKQRGVTVLWGRCYENHGAPPYWPWVQVIRSYAQETESDAVLQDMGAGAADIAEMVPSIRESLVELQTRTILEDPEQARFRLFDSISNFFRNATRRQPLALFLDNLHWADKPSLLLLEFLAQEMGTSRLLVVGTYRDMELSRQHPLTETLGELTRERLFHRISLRGIDQGEMASFIEAASGISPTPGLVGAIQSQTEGNPLFITEVVRLMAQEGQFNPARTPSERGVAVNIPEGIREVISKRLNRLSESCSQTLTIASVIGREFGLDELILLIDHLSEDRLLEALDEAVINRIIEEVPQAVDRYQFTHVLIRETLYDELTSSRRVRLHRRIGEAMEDIHGSNLQPHLAQLAYHFFEAARTGSAEQAVKYTSLAGERDISLLAYEEASRYYEMALQAMSCLETADEARQCALLLSLGDAHHKAGESQQAIDSFRKAADVARRLGSSVDFAQAAVGLEETSWRPGLFGGPAVELLEEALTLLDPEDSILRSRVLAGMVRALYFSGLPDRAAALTREAVEVARRLGDLLNLVNTLNITGFSHRRPEMLEQRLAFAEEALTAAGGVRDNDTIMDIYAWLLFDLAENGNVQEIGAALEDFRVRAERIRQPFYIYIERSYRAGLAIAQGRFEEAEDLTNQALTIGQRLKGQDPSGAFGMKMFTIRKEQGRLREIAPAVRMFIQERSSDSAWKPGLALIYSELDMEAEARAEFENLAADGFEALPQDAMLVVCLVYLAEVCAFLSDVERAPLLYELLRPWNGHNTMVGGGVADLGCASRFLGLLSTVLSDWPTAERHFQDALEMDSKMGAKTWLAHSQYDFARMLLKRSYGGDQARAESLLLEAQEIAQELGMASLLERVTNLRVQVAAMSPGRASSPAVSYPEGLTQREVEVLGLVALGRSNAEIGTELIISLNTVARHVSNILQKTRCANRAEAASFAVRNNLVPQ